MNQNTYVGAENHGPYSDRVSPVQACLTMDRRPTNDRRCHVGKTPECLENLSQACEQVRGQCQVVEDQHMLHVCFPRCFRRGGRFIPLFMIQGIFLPVTAVCGWLPV